MSIVTEIRSTSESVIEALAGRFDALPRPVLAAIGAGDLAAEQLSALRQEIADPARMGAARSTDAGSLTDDLTAAAQHVAVDAVARVQQLVAEVAASGGLPQKVQHTVAELPVRAAQLRDDMSAGSARDTLAAYAQLFTAVYGSLADRGDKSWLRIRSASLRPGTVVDAADPVAAPAAALAPGAARPASGAGAAAGVVHSDEPMVAAPPKAGGPEGLTKRSVAAAAGRTAGRTPPRTSAVRTADGT